MKKIRVGVIFGGQSPEHEISIQSALNVLQGVPRTTYDVVPIGIDKEGMWHLVDENELAGTEFSFSIGALPFSVSSLSDVIDVAFPIVHGPLGEDGALQGLLKLAGIPFVGSDVLSSAIAMDKDVMKRLLQEAGIATPRFLVVRQNEVDIDAIIERLGLPLFVKPANLGSSVGISKVKRKEALMPALEEAFLYDRKVVIEEAVCGREIECAVLGNEQPIASLPGEIIPQGEFYSYEAKYIDVDGASFVIPALLEPKVAHEIRQASIKVFKTLCCEGMARVDFFLCDDGRLLVNELNTIPGFTKISLYPRLWEASGISRAELVNRLVQLAIMKSKTALPTSAAFPL